MEQELIQRLSAAFTLVAGQVNESKGHGYRIHMNASAPWHELGSYVKYCHVQLCGINPISGEDVKSENIRVKFDFTTTSQQTGVLTYHGKFRLCCSAHLTDGRVIPFKEQEISLVCPQNCPYVSYTQTTKGDFRHLVLKSNCWANCEGKLWLRFDGHEQQLTLPVRPDKTLRCYVCAKTDVELAVADNSIEVRNGR